MPPRFGVEYMMPSRIGTVTPSQPTVTGSMTTVGSEPTPVSSGGSPTTRPTPEVDQSTRRLSMTCIAVTVPTLTSSGMRSPDEKDVAKPSVCVLLIHRAPS